MGGGCKVWFCKHRGCGFTPFSSLLFHSQDPVWSKPTFLFWRTFFAGPLSSTESSITRVSVAKLWGTPVFKVGATPFQSAGMSLSGNVLSRIAHISGITAPQISYLLRISPVFFF